MKRVGKLLRAARPIITVIAVVAAITALFIVASKDATFAVLQSRGEVANAQRDLVTFATILSLIVIIPVFIMVFVITHRYRADKPKGAYRPNWNHSRTAETIWWGIPILIIGILSVVIYTSSHKLDPFRPLDSNKQPMTIEVVSLQWKWLFIYPEQGIATVNYVRFPEDTPIQFKVTADSPMNAFWIPQLGSQIYAMNGMESQVNLMADGQGIYDGRSSNISGEGFAKMAFKAQSVSDANFAEWVASVKADTNSLSSAAYDELAKPGTDIAIKQYGSVEERLFSLIISKFMSHDMPADENGESVDHTQHNMQEHEQYMEDHDMMNMEHAQ